VRVAYLVSRFPHVSETFIVRGMDAVSAEGVTVLPPAARKCGEQLHAYERALPARPRVPSDREVVDLVLDRLGAADRAAHRRCADERLIDATVSRRVAGPAGRRPGGHDSCGARA
jgi:hypothetical protein